MYHVVILYLGNISKGLKVVRNWFEAVLDGLFQLSGRSRSELAGNCLGPP